MPIPKPHDGESHQDFVGRCMGDEVMASEYDDAKQRYAICQSSWERAHKEAAMGGKLVRKYYAVPRAAGPDDEGVTITTMDVDLEADRVYPEGGDLQLYLKNPVVLWLHDAYGHTASAGIPIGSTRGLEIIPGKGIRATGIDWTEGDPFAERVKNAWRQGKIRGASIGFIPLEARPNAEGGNDILKWKLLEWSLVPIPANPMAIRSVGDHTLALTAKTVQAWDVDPELMRPPVPILEHKNLVTRWPGAEFSQNSNAGGTTQAAAPRFTIEEPADPVRWNKSLSAAFDVTLAEFAPATAEYALASAYLGIDVKLIDQNGTLVPSPRMGSFLSALDEELGQWLVHDVRNLTLDGRECPPVHEVIQLNSKLRADFLVSGARFMEYRSDGVRLVLRLQPTWAGLAVTTYVHRDAHQRAQGLLDCVWARAKELNYLKGEAFSLSGEFLSKTAETWEDLYLSEKNEPPLRRIVERINAKGAELDNRGIFLMGPPGTGKTLAGRVIMNTAQATFIWLSARDFYRAGAFGGLEYAFELARECAPAVLFIEDVDNWLRSETVDLLKTQMDGIARTKGIVTILTTNFPERMPEALIDRPGRFHDVLQIDLPDEGTRARMLARWMPELGPAGALSAAVEATVGYSGAHIRELANFAHVLREEDGTLDEAGALGKALAKLREQRELITAVQTADSRYRPAKAIEDLVVRFKGTLGLRVTKGIRAGQKEGRAMATRAVAPGTGEPVITLEEMAELCPACAETMRAKGLTALKIGALLKREGEGTDINPGTVAALCDKFGDKEGFRTRCMAWAEGKEIADPAGFCNDLKSECFKAAEAVTTKQAEGEPAEEAAELVHFQAMKTMLDQAEAVLQRASALVAGLIRDNGGADTELEEAVETSRLTMLQALCEQVCSAIEATCSIAALCMADEAEDMGVMTGQPGMGGDMMGMAGGAGETKSGRVQASRNVERLQKIADHAAQIAGHAHDMMGEEHDKRPPKDEDETEAAGKALLDAVRRGAHSGLGH